MDTDSTAERGNTLERFSGVEDPWDETINLETKFYEEGYRAGHDHGQLHGLYEGRELGQEKAWEIWEEVGYMEGFARFWMEDGILRVNEQDKGKGKDARSVNHARLLLGLIYTFPTLNPTSSLPDQPTTSSTETSNGPPNTSSDSTISTGTSTSEAEPDLIILLSSIRARYKLLCSSLGVRPRLVAAAGKDGSLGAEGDGEDVEDVRVVVEAEGVVQGIEGPMKGVDTRMLRY